MPSRRVIPGLPLSLGYTLFYLTLMVLIPLGSLALKASQLTFHQFWNTVTDTTVMAAYRLTFSASLIAAVINGIFGLLIAWVLVRYRFYGRPVLDAMIDFPFALPTAVAGLTFSSLYLQQGWIGRLGVPLSKAWNGIASLIHIPWRLAADCLAFSNTNTRNNVGVVLVLIFVGLPFVVRTVQPVLQEFEAEYEQAAMSLGAGRWTTFRRVIFPEIFPAWLSGLALAFARAVGEYGSVIFIASNIPGKSQIAPMQIFAKLDDFKYAEATAIGVVLLGTSLLVLLLINGVEAWSRRYAARA
jgi:sulfate/thiosulfate transport system permease protein